MSRSKGSMHRRKVRLRPLSPNRRRVRVQDFSSWQDIQAWHLQNRRASSTSGPGAAGAHQIVDAVAASSTTSLNRRSPSSATAPQTELAKKLSSSQSQADTISAVAALTVEQQQQQQQQSQHMSPSYFLDADLMVNDGGPESISQEFLFDWEVDPPPPPPSSTEERDYGTDTAGCSDSATAIFAFSSEGRLLAGQDQPLLASAPTNTSVGDSTLARRLPPSQHGRHCNPLASGEPYTAADQQTLSRLVSLTEIVRVLETSVHSKKHHTPDAIMKTNKACMADIASLFGCEKPLGNCRSCCLLITCALDLILTLFEDILESLAALNSKAGHGSDRVASARLLPPVQFGVFELDPEEQLIMTKRILHSELRRFQHMANAFSASVTTACPEHIHNVLDEWWNGMKKRLCRLLSAVAV